MIRPGGVLWLSDWLAFASLIPACVAVGLLLAACGALGLAPDWTGAGLAAAGTLVVYNVDRLRDTRADRVNAPLRTAFVEGHRGTLRVLTAVSGVAALGLALAEPREVQLLCAGVLGLGLLHRRLKRHSSWKPVYVGGAWVAVTAGIPALAAGDPAAVPWLLAVYAGAVAGNVVATTLRDDRQPRRLWLARGLALAGMGVALAGPGGCPSLAAIPGCELLALAAFQPGERYGLVVLDGALLVGAALALAVQSLQ